MDNFIIIVIYGDIKTTSFIQNCAKQKAECRLVVVSKGLIL